MSESARNVDTIGGGLNMLGGDTGLGVVQVIGVDFVDFFFSSSRRHTRLVSDWSSDVCSSDLPPTPAKTYGYYRAEILAALVNALVLLVVAGAVLVEAYRRLRAPPDVLGGPMLAVAVVGLAANLGCAWLLHADAATSLNVRGAYLHVLSDALASVGVVAAALVVVATGWTLADPLASVAIALIIAPRTWGLLKQAVNVLLEGTPTHLDLAEIEAAIVRVPGVRRVHDLHVWTLTSGREAMSAHVIVTDVGESDRLLRQLHEVLHARFGIDHTTIQLEMEPTVVLRIQGSNPV